MAQMRFELVSPERRLAAGAADMVTIPGAAGDFGALPGHSAFVSTLRPGVLTVTGGEAAGEYFVTGGFAEVTPEGVTVLAEEAAPMAEAKRDWLAPRIAAARAALESAPEDGRAAAALRLDDFEAAAARAS